MGLREMTQPLRTFATLADDQGSIPSIYMIAHVELLTSFKRSSVLFWPLQTPGRHMVYIVLHSQNIHTLNNINKSKFKNDKGFGLWAWVMLSVGPQELSLRGGRTPGVWNRVTAGEGAGNGCVSTVPSGLRALTLCI